MIETTNPNRRVVTWGDRRQMPRGGRRSADDPGRFPTLLIAASYEPVRQVCASYLERFGFQVENAPSSADAMAIIRSNRPRVVISDMALPEAVAVPVLHLVDEPGEWTASPPVTPGTHRLDAALAKPFALSALLGEVRRLLRAQADAPPV